MVLQILTGDSWAEAIANPIQDLLPGSYAFFSEKTMSDTCPLMTPHCSIVRCHMRNHDAEFGHSGKRWSLVLAGNAGTPHVLDRCS